MKKSELIKKLQAIPEDLDVCIYDWETNAREDFGGVYSDFEIDIISFEDDEARFTKEPYNGYFVPWIALGFQNPIFEEEEISEPNTIDFLELSHPIKGKLKIPIRQFVLNDRQQFAAIGIDFTEGVELGDHAGIKYDSLGKLDEQSVIFNAQILNSLNLDNWDFENYPNPEIVLITKE